MTLTQSSTLRQRLTAEGFLATIVGDQRKADSILRMLTAASNEVDLQALEGAARDLASAADMSLEDAREIAATYELHRANPVLMGTAIADTLARKANLSETDAAKVKALGALCDILRALDRQQGR